MHGHRSIPGDTHFWTHKTVIGYTLTRSPSLHRHPLLVQENDWREGTLGKVGKELDHSVLSDLVCVPVFTGPFCSPRRPSTTQRGRLGPSGTGTGIGPVGVVLPTRYWVKVFVGVRSLKGQGTSNRLRLVAPLLLTSGGSWGSGTIILFEFSSFIFLVCFILVSYFFINFVIDKVSRTRVVESNAIFFDVIFVRKLDYHFFGLFYFYSR